MIPSFTSALQHLIRDERVIIGLIWDAETSPQLYRNVASNVLFGAVQPSFSPVQSSRSSAECRAWLGSL